MTCPHDRQLLPPPYYRDDHVTLYAGDALDVLSGMPEKSVDCVVTSPPYWGLRDYSVTGAVEEVPAGERARRAADHTTGSQGKSTSAQADLTAGAAGVWVGGDPHCSHRVAVGRGASTAQSIRPNAVGSPMSAAHRGGSPQRCRRCGAHRHDRQYGLEATPEDYVNRLRSVFAEVRRVLTDTGTVWLNLGDSYSAQPPGRAEHAMRASTLSGQTAAAPLRESVRSAGVDRSRVIPRKNMIGIPWRVALALQEDGWIVRNAIVWAKKNPMPESVRDRLSTTYEFVFLLVKQPRYFFNLDAIRVPLARPDALLREDLVIGGARKGKHGGIGATARRRGRSVYGSKYHQAPDRAKAARSNVGPGRPHNAAHPRGKNPGDVWHLATRPLPEAHFAAFPIDIPLRCIAAGCPEGGVVLDPFSGAGTSGLAAYQLGRRYVGIDTQPAFHDMGIRRLDRLKRTSPRPGNNNDDQ